MMWDSPSGGDFITLVPDCLMDIRDSLQAMNRNICGSATAKRFIRLTDDKGLPCIVDKNSVVCVYSEQDYMARKTFTRIGLTGGHCLRVSTKYEDVLSMLGETVAE